MCEARESHSSIVAIDKIFTMGGSGTGGEDLRSMEIYDPAKNVWTPGTPMLEARAHFHTGTVNGFVYALGGRIDPIAIDQKATIERYCILSNTWEKVCGSTLRLLSECSFLYS